MHRLTVHYSNPEDPAEFERRYLEEHVPMVEPMTDVQRFTWSFLRPLGGDQGVHMVAELDFADAESMKATLKSPEMAEAGAHAQTLGATVTMYTGEVRDSAG